jgi:hypothetical protein
MDRVKVGLLHILQNRFRDRTAALSWVASLWMA